ncbi:MAG: AgmX/PglI C-terminal domain-containing protein [Deltaproteobacteria bacterium]|nr:AgmX/PglI C-terminal domain-containing protein [Deltaproteobacteria bacterium]
MRARIAITTVLLAACGTKAPPPRATGALARMVRPGVTILREGASDPDAVSPWRRVELDARLKTDEHGRATLELDMGAWLLVDARTDVKVGPDGATIESGRVWIDAEKIERTTFRAGGALLHADDASFAISVASQRAEVYVAKGEVTYELGSSSGRIESGDTGTFQGSSANVGAEELWDDWTGGLAEPGPRRPRGAQGVGQIWARRTDEIGQAREPLAIRQHEVRVTVRGDLARTEVDQTFFNPRSDTLEGIYEIRLPRGAIVESFSVDQSGSLVPGRIVPHAREGSPASVDDAILAWSSDDRYTARLFPVEAGKTRRVVLSYSEWLTRRDEVRTYVYPMGGDSRPPLIGELAIDVDLSNAHMTHLQAGMGARAEGSFVRLRKSDFRPRSDFYLDLVGDGAEKKGPHMVAVRASGEGGPAVGGDQDYLYLRLPVERPDPAEGVDLVVLYDDSAATEGGELELGRSVVEAILRGLGPKDRVAVLAADLGAHAVVGDRPRLERAKPDAVERILEAVARRRTGGATDLGQALVEGVSALPLDTNASVVYVGDARPTVGELTFGQIDERLARLDRSFRLYGIGIGPTADMDLLSSLCRGAGFAQRIDDAPEAVRAVSTLLADASRPAVTDVVADLGTTIERVYPKRRQTVRDGETLNVIGRVHGELPKVVTLRGKRSGKAFEQRIDLKAEKIDDWGDLRRRWASERLGDLIFEDAGREAVRELGVRYGLVTPFTSMVVGGGLAELPPGERPDVRDTRWEPRSTARWQPFSDDMGIGEVGFAADDAFDRAEVGAMIGGPHASTEELFRNAIGARDDGARHCFESRLRARPDLSGEVQVQVTVEPNGEVGSATIASSSVPDAEVGRCVARSVGGMRLPPVPEAPQVSFVYVFNFNPAIVPLHEARRCSRASTLDLDIRRRLWRERLSGVSGVDGVMAMWTRALQDCELGSWTDRRTLLDLMLKSLGGAVAGIGLHRAFEGDDAIQNYLRRQILRSVRNARELARVRRGLRIGYWVDWETVDRLTRNARTDRERLAVLRQFLLIAPDDVELRLRLMLLFEKMGQPAEAQRAAYALLSEPAASPRVRATVGEMLIRMRQNDEAKRAFAEIVEFAPADPWARRRLGDLYRAHGWFEEAQREYETLSRLTPDDDAVLLLLSAAAAGAGRMDEALRLEARLADSAEAGGDPGAPRWARLWLSVRLARLRDEARRAGREDDLAALMRRTRSAGVLRDTPELKAFLVWEHPDADLQLLLGYPGAQGLDRAPELGAAFGVEGVLLERRERGSYRFEVQGPTEDPRTFPAELVVLLNEGSANERILRQPLELTRARTRLAVLLDGDALRTVAPLRPPATAAP